MKVCTRPILCLLWILPLLRHNHPLCWHNRLLVLTFKELVPPLLFPGLFTFFRLFSQLPFCSFLLGDPLNVLLPLLKYWQPIGIERLQSTTLKTCPQESVRNDRN